MERSRVGSLERRGALDPARFRSVEIFLSASSSDLRLAFVPSAEPLDYGRRIGRLRWRRAFGVTETLEPRAESPASCVEGPGICILVRDDRALPAPSRGHLTNVPAGFVVPCRPLSVELARVHTLREMEDDGWPASPGGSLFSEREPAVAFRPAEVTPAPGEGFGEFTGRLFANALGEGDPTFRAFVFEDCAEYERPELVARLPEAARRLCDVGCGPGAAAAAWKRRSGGFATGIEKHETAAARARLRLDRVIEGDALAVLEDLSGAGEQFDAFLFADVLEHLEDPVRALTLAAELASPSASLVASVPNVGHLSVVRDLILGRFDPLPAGLLDVGHLRWFDRHWLQEALEEAGWSVASVESLPGAPPPEAEQFLHFFGEWSGLDRESLLTYQWVAVALPSAGTIR
jgi:SAM-dependent methyltransferase